MVFANIKSFIPNGTAAKGQLYDLDVTFSGYGPDMGAIVEGFLRNGQQLDGKKFLAALEEATRDKDAGDRQGQASPEPDGHPSVVGAGPAAAR